MPMPGSVARTYRHGMTPTRPHLAAATFLAASGLLVGLGAAAIAAVAGFAAIHLAGLLALQLSEQPLYRLHNATA
jgi:hypothetical protein